MFSFFTVGLDLSGDPAGYGDDVGEQGYYEGCEFAADGEEDGEEGDAAEVVLVSFEELEITSGYPFILDHAGIPSIFPPPGHNGTGKTRIHPGSIFETGLVEG